MLQKLGSQDCNEFVPILELLIWADDALEEFSHGNLRISDSYLIIKEPLLFLGLAIDHPSKEIFRSAREWNKLWILLAQLLERVTALWL